MYGVCTCAIPRREKGDLRGDVDSGGGAEWPLRVFSGEGITCAWGWSQLMSGSSARPRNS